MTTVEAAQAVATRFASKILARTDFRGEVSFSVRPEDLPEVAKFCREELEMDYLLDVSSVDHFGEDPRFEVVYELASIQHEAHIRLKTRVGEDNPQVESVVNLWATADWHEREVWDMMGIRFVNHPDLRRILMWEGYPYHPLRKDFPLEGIPSEQPDVAFSGTAPLAGGPFVTAPTPGNTQIREPRARPAGGLPPSDTFIAEP